MTHEEYFANKYPDQAAILSMNREKSPAVDVFEVMYANKLFMVSKSAWECAANEIAKK